MKPHAINPSVMLWYNKPATIWNEALPLGNGRLGAMVYGKTENEIIQFNEETLWTGQPHDYAHEGAYEYLDELRRLLWEGRQGEAHELGNRHFMSQPFGQFSYQPFGNILLSFPGHENVDNYHRRLNLQDAISSVFYEVDGVRFKREVFSSFPDKAIVVRLESSQNGTLNFTAGLDSPHSDYEVSVDGDQIILKGKANDYPKELDREGEPYPKSELTFEARLKLEQQGGGLVQNDNAIEIVNARNATLYLVAATSFVNYNDISANPAQRCDDYLTNLEGKSFKALKERH
ncbi:MAG: glycoside hydrolase family 95 protein, partial [Bacteroidales bacterium]|nr:glycoside hydrolase family 95 protein [Bacteroidales bacterium]